MNFSLNYLGLKIYLLCDVQHGFVPDRSYMTQILMVIELWYNGRPVDAISIDFDILPHERLLEKLKSYGIDGTRRNVSSD